MKEEEYSVNARVEEAFSAVEPEINLLFGEPEKFYVGAMNNISDPFVFGKYIITASPDEVLRAMSQVYEQYSEADVEVDIRLERTEEDTDVIVMVLPSLDLELIFNQAQRV